MREVLRDQVYLARPLELEQLRLTNDFVDGERAVLTAHQWNCAEGAAVVAAFADLHVPDVRKISGVEAHTRVQPFARFAEESSFGQLWNEPLHLGGAKKEVDFRHRVEQLLLVTLDHAADRDHRLASALGLEPCGLDHRVDRLLLGSVDEAAGVDDYHFRLREIGGVLGGIIGQLREIPLAVDGILVAAERDESDFHASVRS